MANNQEYKITLVDRVAAEVQLESSDQSSPVFEPPAGDGWELHNVSIGQFKYVVTWVRSPLRAPMENSASFDAFGRLRVSEAHSLFESQLQNDKAPQLWAEQITGGATSTHMPAEAAVRMRVGTALGDRVVRQSRIYTRYQPGKSHLVLLTGVLGPRKVGVRQRAGYFDGNDGIFFEMLNGNLRVVRRSSALGTVVDTAIDQTNWSLDRLDGTGASGVTIDTTKTNIYVMDFQWLGVGRVRVGVVIDGSLIYCHEFYHANHLTEVYMNSANLPVRYEIENVTSTSSSTDMKQICSSVSSEGGFNPRGYTRHDSLLTPKGISTTMVPIFSVRPKAAFKGTWFEPTSYDILNTANSFIYFQVVLSPTLIGSSWRDSASTTYAEVDTSATSYSGGTIIAGGFVNSKDRFTTNLDDNIPVIGTNLDGTRDSITIVAQTISGTANVICGVNWKEVR